MRRPRTGRRKFGMWKSRRRAAALVQGIVILALPFLRVGGESALRFDIAGMRLFLFGAVVWIDEFHIVLAGTLFLLLLGIGVTVILGRVWCGWICPQTVLPELAAFAASPLPEGARRTARAVLLVPLTAVVSFSLILYFLPPAEAVGALARSRAVAGIFLVQWAVLYVLVSIVGPLFCRTVCPYSMLQGALFDADTLTVGFDPLRNADCMQCDLCRKVCPVEIDIRKGLQRECTACAECIDACARMTGTRGIEPLIGYRGTVVRAKALAWAGIAAGAALAFPVLLARQPQVSLSVQWVGQVPGAHVNSYRYVLRNRRDAPVSLTLDVDEAFELIGGRTVSIPARSRAAGEVMVRKAGQAGGSVTFLASAPGIGLRGKAGFP